VTVKSEGSWQSRDQYDSLLRSVEPGNLVTEVTGRRSGAPLPVRAVILFLNLTPISTPETDQSCSVRAWSFPKGFGIPERTRDHSAELILFFIAATTTALSPSSLLFNGNLKLFLWVSQLEREADHPVSECSVCRHIQPNVVVDW
jgi:hypothetical protein